MKKLYLRVSLNGETTDCVCFCIYKDVRGDGIRLENLTGGGSWDSYSSRSFRFLKIKREVL